MVLWLFIEYKSIVKMANPIIVVMFRKHFKIEHTHESTEQTGYEKTTDNQKQKWIQRLCIGWKRKMGL